MKVICEHIDECMKLNDHNQNLCNHSQPHDKHYGCLKSICGLMLRNNINTQVAQVKCISQRKYKLIKLNEKSNLP